MEAAMDEKSARLIVLCFVMIALSTVAIILRIWSRALLPRQKFQMDDWTALAAFPFVIAALVSWLTWAIQALGRHNVPLTSSVLKIMLSMKVTWDAGIALSRISAVFFYRRIFTIDFRVRFWVGISVNIAWFLMLFFYVMFSCSPPNRQWDRSLPGTCQKELPGQVLSSVTSFVIDLYILVMPLPTLWGLQMKLLKKILMASVFLLGYSVPVLSLGRFATTIKANAVMNSDPNWGFGLQGPWAILEVSISFIGITIPGIFFLINRALRHGPLALFDDREYSGDQEASSSSSRFKLRGTSISSAGGALVSFRNANVAQHRSRDEVLIHQEMSVSVDEPAAGGRGTVTPNSTGSDSNEGRATEIYDYEYCGKAGGGVPNGGAVSQCKAVGTGLSSSQVED